MNRIVLNSNCFLRIFHFRINTLIEKKILVLFFIISSIFFSNNIAQTIQCKDTYNWIFGSHAGVTFMGSAQPTPSAITGSAINMSEGCASISDESGNLLFYTDGLSIWDATNTTLPNGTGLAGGGWSAQSSVIVPLPDEDSTYYVFTVKDWISPTTGGGSTAIGFNYSIVDLRLPGNGTSVIPLGDVDINNKNIPIDTNVREQVTAIYHENCEDIWIVTHRGSKWHTSDKYLAYLLTSTGLNTTPVISSIGMTYYTNNRFGYLKPSHNGKMICTTLGRGASGSNFNGTTVELLEFSNSIGVVSNPIVIADSGSTVGAYSSEFSPDNNILYVVGFDGTFIDQYDLSSGIQDTIVASKTNVATGNAVKSCLQLGPDNKIYVSRNNSNDLGVIDDPNSLLNCNYIDQAVNLGTGIAKLGLPTFWKRQYVKIFSNITICQGDSTFVGGAYQNTTGTYNDTTYGTSMCEGCDSILKTNLTVNSQFTNNQSISICQGDSVLLEGNYQTSTGIYYDSLLSISGCDSIISTTLVVNLISTINTSSNICQGDSIFIGGAYQNTAGIYNDTLIGGSINGCDSIISTLLSILTLPDASIISDSLFCESDPSIDLQVVTSGGVWSGNGIINTTNGTFDPANAASGIHQIIYTISGICGDADTIDIFVNENPVISSVYGDDSCMLSIGFIDLNISGGNTPYEINWSNGAVSDSLFELVSGIYWVIVTDDNDCVKTDTITIGDNLLNCSGDLWVPNIFSPNNDGVNDVLYVRGIETVSSFLFIIYDRWGEKVFETTDPLTGWDGTYKDKTMNSAVFTYVATATFINGSEASINGTVTLVN